MAGTASGEERRRRSTKARDYVHGRIYTDVELGKLHTLLDRARLKIFPGVRALRLADRADSPEEERFRSFLGAQIYPLLGSVETYPLRQKLHAQYEQEAQEKIARFRRILIAINRFLSPNAPTRTRQQRAQVLIERLVEAAPYKYVELFEAHRRREDGFEKAKQRFERRVAWQASQSDESLATIIPAIERLRRDPGDQLAGQAVSEVRSKVHAAVEQYDALTNRGRGRPPHERFNEIADRLADAWLDEMSTRVGGDYRSLLPQLLARRSHRHWHEFVRTALVPLARYRVELPKDLERAISRRLIEKRKKWREFLTSR